ncbi:PilZ domain-containing protein [Noviherbaspirillum humi]|uniref:PilZ domain-containing protein n=1 Tax=Noviherbaspirillum humi TaxID=1688639 RepID=A0A239MB10_9BURK|nr:PilZ domain-containing protein [Noviherbaspirillum humi]SNT39372.1 PilZ domain-containing protein [Noviherbaspirillum humi]
MNTQSERFTNQRSEQRFNLQFPVSLGFAEGVTRDISASGCYIETSKIESIESEIIDFTFFMPGPHGGIERKCIGKVVRIEQNKETTGLGVQIIGSQLLRH